MKRKASQRLQKQGNLKRARRLTKRDQVQILRQIGEKKGVDILLTLSPVISTTSTNASSFVLNLVGPGTGSYNRVGRSISMQSVRLRGVANVTCIHDATTGNLQANVMRMVVVYDKQPSGTLPAFDTIFGYTLQDATEASTYLAPLKYDNMGRFQVMRDCTYVLNPANDNAEGGTVDASVYRVTFDEFVKLGGRQTVYSGQTNPCSIADISTGALYVFFRADGETATNYWSIESDSISRLRYID